MTLHTLHITWYIHNIHDIHKSYIHTCRYNTRISIQWSTRVLHTTCMMYVSEVCMYVWIVPYMTYIHTYVVIYVPCMCTYYIHVMYYMSCVTHILHTYIIHTVHSCTYIHVHTLHSCMYHVVTCNILRSTFMYVHMRYITYIHRLHTVLYMTCMGMWNMYR